MLECLIFEGFKSNCFELLFEVFHFPQLFNLSLLSYRESALLFNVD